MSFIQTVLLLLGTLLLIAFTVVVLVVYFGRKLYFSWTKPYKRAHDSLEKLSNKSLPFLQNLHNIHSFIAGFARKEKRATYIKHSFLCIEPTYERASILNVTERKTEKVHVMAKTTKKLTNEDIDVAAIKVKIFKTRNAANSKTDRFIVL